MTNDYSQLNQDEEAKPYDVEFGETNHGIIVECELSDEIKTICVDPWISGLEEKLGDKFPYNK